MRDGEGGREGGGVVVCRSLMLAPLRVCKQSVVRVL